MDQKITYLILGLVIGVGSVFLVMNYQITDLKGKVADTQMQYVTLYSQYQLLGSQKDGLQTQYDQLNQEKSTLQKNYTLLQNNYNQLEQKAQIASSSFLDISEDLTSLQQDLKSYCYLPNSFSRTLNGYEVQKVTTVVNTMLSTEPDYLAAYNDITNYVIGHISQRSDVPFPYIQTTTTQYNGTTVNSGYTLKERTKYINTPEITLSLKAGNSESQTILQYAMMKYYDHNINGVVNPAYFTELTFSDGTTHDAIFCPVHGGQICIFDPSGNYVTRNQGITMPKLAASELGSYFNYWNSQNLTITNYTLYNVDTTNGSYSIIFNGSLADLIAFMSK